MDWTAPWLDPYRSVGERVAAKWEQGIPVHQALAMERGAPVAPVAPVTFVPHDDLPDDEPYEAFIFRTGQCPTRENVHDFFNGLVWHTFPQAKARLNLLHAAQMEQGAVKQRGPVRDAITVFDENGAVMHAPQPIMDALVARDWRGLFVDLRPLWKDVSVTVFGHALLEKLVSPRKALTAHVWHRPCPAPDLPAMDAWLAAQLDAEALASKPFTPLPVMGIPGWCAGNQNFSFYDDSLVFRPGRLQNDS